MKPTLQILSSLLIATSFAACVGEGDDIGQYVGEAGERLPLIRETQPKSVVLGAFNGQNAIYGYTVELKKGAKLSASLKLGAETRGTIAIYFPYEDHQFWGDNLATVNDEAASLDVDAEAPGDGTYLVAFRIPQRPTANTPYTFQTSCEGSVEQCGDQTIDDTLACISDNGPVLVEALSGDVVFDHCNYELRGGFAVSSLAIMPDVNVAGTGAQLSSPGKITALGTADSPITLTGVPLRSTSTEVMAVSNITTDASVFARRLDITDSIFRKGGVRAELDITMKRSLVEGTHTGVRIDNPQAGLIEDSVITNNTIGLSVGSGNGWRQCHPPAPSRPRRYDPVIRYSDITHNRTAGIWVTLEDTLIQVEHSNLIHNGQAITLRVQSVADGSYINNNNFFSNVTTPYVQSFHRSGWLGLQRNYWGEGSGPEISDRWRVCSGVELDTFGGSASKAVPEAGPRPTDLPRDVDDACFDIAELSPVE